MRRVRNSAVITIALGVLVVGVALGGGILANATAPNQRNPALISDLCEKTFPTEPPVSDTAHLGNTSPRGDFHVGLLLCQTHVPTGTSIRAIETFTNVTARPIYVNDCWYHDLVLGIASPQTPFNPAFTANLCGVTYEFHRGRTYLASTIQTTYQGCSVGGPSGSGTNRVPACVESGGQHLLPPLPVGTYTTKFAGHLTFDKGVSFAPSQLVQLAEAR